MPMRLIPSALAAFLIIAPLGTAHADGGESSDNAQASTNPDYAAGLKAVEAKDFTRALAAFGKVVAANDQNPDAWNYLGFSTRKLGRFEEAERHYAKALAINPEHRGANEYLGELYLQTGRLKKAEERLALLDRVCWLGCDAYTDLKHAVDQFKKTGKYTATD